MTEVCPYSLTALSTAEEGMKAFVRGAEIVADN